MDSPRTVSRSSWAFFVGTLLSRFSGLGRDITMAFVFGSNPAIAAFMVAFRFANAIRRLFGEGPLPAGFIPHFEQLKSESAEKAAQFFRDFFFSLAAFLSLFICVVDIGLVALWKWGNIQPDNAQILYLTILMMPGIVFICLFGLSSALLQCEGTFFLTGFAPVGFNLVWIVAAWWLRNRPPSDAVVYLSLAIVLAFFAQWILLAPRLITFLKKSLSWKASLRPRLFSEELKRVMKPFLLGGIGVGAVQINSALDAVFARVSSLEGPAYLWYAIRIQQLPLALFAIALSSALFPPLARAFKAEEHSRYAELIHFALRRSFSLIFPCTLALFVLGGVGVNLLYGRGDFSQTATCETILCLWGYGLGLVPSVFVLFLASAFYALKEYKITTRASILSVLLNICCTALFVFVFHFGSFSIALATSLSAFFNFFYLAHHLQKRMVEPLFAEDVIQSFSKVAHATLVAACTTGLVGYFFVGDLSWGMLLGQEVLFTRTTLTQIVQFIALGGTFLVVFLFYARLCNAQDVLELLKLKKKKTQELDVG